MLLFSERFLVHFRGRHSGFPLSLLGLHADDGVGLPLLGRSSDLLLGFFPAWRVAFDLVPKLNGKYEYC